MQICWKTPVDWPPKNERTQKCSGLQHLLRSMRNHRKRHWIYLKQEDDNRTVIYVEKQTLTSRRSPTSVILPTMTSPVWAVYLQSEQSERNETRSDEIILSGMLEAASSHSHHVFSACTEIRRLTLFTTPHNVAWILLSPPS